MNFVSSLNLRPIQPDDSKALAKLLQDIMAEFASPGQGFALDDPEIFDMYNAYSRPKHAYYVVLSDRVVVGGGGYAPLQNGPVDTCEVRKMYFTKEIRGLGMGRVLLDKILISAKKDGYKRAYLETIPALTRAIKLYKAFGFKQLEAPLGDTGHYGCDTWYEKRLDDVSVEN